jgi:hypothetical protein
MSNDEIVQRIYDTHQRVQHRKQAPASERDLWIWAGRKLFDPGERQPCVICGRFKGIAQAHHVIPLTTQYDRGFKYPDQEFSWLCPNHHAIVHLFIIGDNRSMEIPAMRARGRTTRAVHPDLSEEEFTKVMELARMAGRSPE